MTAPRVSFRVNALTLRRRLGGGERLQSDRLFGRDLLLQQVPSGGENFVFVSNQTIGADAAQDHSRQGYPDARYHGPALK